MYASVCLLSVVFDYTRRALVGREDIIMDPRAHREKKRSFGIVVWNNTAFDNDTLKAQCALFGKTVSTLAYFCLSRESRLQNTREGRGRTNSRVDGKRTIAKNNLFQAREREHSCLRLARRRRRVVACDLK